MSKLFHTSLITAYCDLADEEALGTLSPDDKDFFSALLNRVNDISRRLEDLHDNLDILDGPSLEEFYELRNTTIEINDMQAKHMSSEDRERIIGNLSSREEQLPYSGKLWLDSLRDAQEKVR